MIIQLSVILELYLVQMLIPLVKNVLNLQHILNQIALKYVLQSLLNKLLDNILESFIN